jgi:PAS domain S-box-containing protein
MTDIIIQEQDKKVIWNKVIIAVAIAMAFPVIGWLIEIAINPAAEGFFMMHIQNPVHFIMGMIPVFSGMAVYYYEKWRIKDREKLQNSIEEKDKKIEKNLEFARKIGEGNLDTDLDIYGEDDILGKSLLVMRDNLLANKKREAAENWISNGKDLLSNILRRHTKLEDLAYDVVVNLVQQIDVIQGALYIYDEEKNTLTNYATHAYNRHKYIKQEFNFGYGLIGQCAYEKDIIYRTEIPDDYVSITSGILGDKKPQSILIAPLISEEKLQGVIEFASLKDSFPELTIRYIKELGGIIGQTIYSLCVNQRTQILLQESQQMTQELQENEEELRQNAEEMRATQEELEKSNKKLAAQINEVENAHKRLHALLENASEIISIYDKNHNIKYVSPSVSKILGFAPEEMIQGNDMERLTRKGQIEIKNMLDQLLQRPEKSITIQYTYIKKDGKKLFMETTGRNLLDDPAIEGIILNSEDITAWKKAEKEERMRSRMQSLSENSLDMILRLSTTGEFFYANPVVEDYLGISPSALIHRKIDAIIESDVFYNYFKEAVDTIKLSPKKKNTQLTLPLTIGNDVNERIMSIDAIPEFNDNELETILFVGHDITEAKRIEKEIQDKNKKIEDSINYAERIQSSILPDTKTLTQVFPKSFIFYKPRDVVSGDFPWFFMKGDNVYIAAVDCTGHGVPGALLSLIGYFSLNNVVDQDNDLSAAEICNRVHKAVRVTLKQENADAFSRDGMDIAFCKINTKTMVLQYAGAHRPLYLLRDNNIDEYKGDRKAIGGIPHPKKAEKDFTNHQIKIKNQDRIFFFTDGLPDQLGGKESKKYSSKRIKNAILAHQDFKMSQFNHYFSKDLNQWQGDNKQIDDVLIIGIEF